MTKKNSLASLRIKRLYYHSLFTINAFQNNLYSIISIIPIGYHHAIHAEIFTGWLIKIFSIINHTFHKIGIEFKSKKVPIKVCCLGNYFILFKNDNCIIIVDSKKGGGKKFCDYPELCLLFLRVRYQNSCDFETIFCLSISFHANNMWILDMNIRNGNEVKKLLLESRLHNLIIVFLVKIWFSYFIPISSVCYLV